MRTGRATPAPRTRTAWSPTCTAPAAAAPISPRLCSTDAAPGAPSATTRSGVRRPAAPFPTARRAAASTGGSSPRASRGDAPRGASTTPRRHAEATAAACPAKLGAEARVALATATRRGRRHRAHRLDVAVFLRGTGDLQRTTTSSMSTMAPPVGGNTHDCPPCTRCVPVGGGGFTSASCATVVPS